jgi:hypothetical protein
LRRHTSVSAIRAATATLTVAAMFSIVATSSSTLAVVDRQKMRVELSTDLFDDRARLGDAFQQ